jgi:hypothetical protein
MTRILFRLAVVVYLLLIAATVAGAWSFITGGRRDPDSQAFPIHIYLGLIAPIAALGIHCLVFIYFLGTGRWVKEVAEAYRIPDDPLPKLTRELKRKAFPPALFAMLVPIATAAAGAAAQTEVLHWGWHATGAVASLIVNLWAFWIELDCVDTNSAVIDQVMKEVERIRRERGLPSNEEALRQREEQEAEMGG